MYIMFIYDRRELGYQAKQDFDNGRRSVLIIDSLIIDSKLVKILVPVILSFTLTFALIDLEPAQAMGLSAKVQHERVQPGLECQVKKPKFSKIDQLTYQQSCKSKLDYLFIIYGSDPKLVAVNPMILQKIQRLRGGSFDTIFEFALFIGLLLYLMSVTTSAPQLNNDQRANWFLPQTPSVSRPASRPTPSGRLFLEKPAEMPQPTYNDLPRVEKTKLPHALDRAIVEPGRPTLKVGYWRIEEKVAPHGAVHHVPSIIKPNGGTKSLKTKENVLKMMDSICNMPRRLHIKWFEDGTYQGNTDRSCAAIHLYDEDQQIIAVFEKETKEFITTCQLTPKEHNELMKTGNFGGGEGWFSAKVNNFPLITYDKGVNSFENDVMGISRVNEAKTSGSSDLGFITPIDNFSSDILKITPNNDSSNLDNS